MFLSSSSLPRNLITDWFRDVATYNPVSYLIEGIRSLVITGWDAEALALGFGFATLLLRDHAVARRCRDGDNGWCGHEALHLRRARRRLALDPQHGRQPGDPAALDHLPAVLPRRLRRRPVADLRGPNFHYPPGYTAFQFVFVFLQSAAFGGVFTGFAVARDFDSGFARRLLLSAPRRSGIIAGYAIGALAALAASPAPS